MTTERYKPPPRSACQEIDNPIWLGADLRLNVHLRCYRNRVVHFSIELKLVEADKTHVVARTDTSDSQVHRHQFYEDGSQQRVVLTEIPKSPEGQQAVHDAYDQCYEYMFIEAEELVRRWRQ